MSTAEREGEGGAEEEEEEVAAPLLLLRGLSADRECARKVLQETVRDPQQRLAKLQVGR
jgi:hypothetical protein